MVTERSIEIGWVLSQLPETGHILDIGSCESSHLEHLSRYILDCMDTRDCRDSLPAEVIFHQESLIGNELAKQQYDVVTSISTLEHIGMPHYGQPYFADGDMLAVHEIWRLLKPGGVFIATVPCGIPKVTSWYRQYDPQQLKHLMSAWWDVAIQYWGFQVSEYVPIDESDVTQYDYVDVISDDQRAGAVAGIVARKHIP